MDSPVSNNDTVGELKTACSIMNNTVDGDESQHLDGDKEAAADLKDAPDVIATECLWFACEKTFLTQHELLEHLKDDHLNEVREQMICLWKDCTRRETKSTLEVHKRHHTGEKPHKCTDKCCSNVKGCSNLRSQTDKKNIICNYQGCNKAFSNASAIAKHQNSAHLNQPTTCPNTKLMYFLISTKGLPDGWVMRVDCYGRFFYVDYNTATTTWVDPRTGQRTIVTSKSVYVDPVYIMAGLGLAYMMLYVLCSYICFRQFNYQLVGRLSGALQIVAHMSFTLGFGFITSFSIFTIIFISAYMVLYNKPSFKVINGWLILSSLMLLLLFSYIYLGEGLRTYYIPEDYIAVAVIMCSFGALGKLCILWKRLNRIQLVYLIIHLALMALAFIKCVPNWFAWIVMGVILTWDLIEYSLKPYKRVST